MNTIDVLKPGMLTSFQDLGRRGYEHLGVPVNGVMDERAHRVANWLVGNSATEATLEITLLGPVLRFNADAVIALCGADLSPTVNQQPIAMNQAVQLAAGSVLAFGARRAGARSYLAVQGGYALQPVMGSTSTYVRGAYGGVDGKALVKGLRIPLKDPTSKRVVQKLPNAPLFPYGVVQGAAAPIRLVMGREHASFNPHSLASLSSQPYRLSAQSDRMGYRLEGPSLQRDDAYELRSEAVTPGTVQVPPDGSPIILMADAQTTGGYPRIANVISVDLPRLAQRAPGDSLRFEWVDLEAAQRLWIAQAEVFARFEHDSCAD